MNQSHALLQRIESLSPEKQALLLKKLAASAQSAAVAAEQPIARQPDRRQAPLSHSQQLLWLVEQREGPSPKYNMPCAYRLVGALDVSAMARTFQAIARRHDSLRTYFSEQNGEPVQCIDPTHVLDVEVIDLSDLTSADQEARVQSLVQANVDWKFDVSRLPLMRIVLIRTRTDEHFLLMNLHHIIYDGWSKGLLLQEMAVLYPAFRDGQPEPCERLPELPIQYGDYAAWQREGRSQEIDRQLQYWKDRLRGSLALLELPADRARPAAPTGNGAGMLMHIPLFLTKKIDALGRSEGASTYMAVLAAFKALLCRLSGRSDIVIGSPVDNRSRRELQHVIGYFLNTSVLRTQVDRGGSFRDLLRAVKQTCLEAYQNQDVALGQVIDALNPPRSLSHTPLFQVMFVFQNAGSANFAMPGIEIERADAVNNTSKYDLYLSFQDTDDGLKGWWTYNTDLFDPDTIKYFSQCLLNLLLDCVANPDKAVGRLSLTEADTARPDFSAPMPFRSMAALFLEQANANPDAVALIDADRGVSYRELASRAAAFAEHLRAQGVQRGDAVAIVLPRSVAQVAAMVSVLLIGAAYVPIDPELPAHRITQQIEDAGPKLVVSSEAVDRELLAGLNAPVLLAEQVVVSSNVALPEPPAITPDDLLYILYTSGSTGKPKGVRGTLGATYNRLAWMWRDFPYRTGDVCALKTTINFVDAVAELWSPLLAGVPSVTVPAADGKDVYRLVRLLARHRVTHFIAVPSLLRSMTEAYPELHESLPSLRSLVSSGEALTVDLFQKLQEALPETTVINIYGSTEVAADATAKWVQTVSSADRSVPVGQPIAGLRTYVFDSMLELSPTGVIGELYIGGAGVNGGYHGHAALTAERFLPDPLAASSGARMFKTGDLARMRRDGDLDLLGRSDHQVKIRGIRIELPEVRTALLKDPDIVDAYVVRKHDAELGDWLGAYLVVHPDREVNLSDIVARLRDTLPDYMVPTAFQLLDKLPLNANSKIDAQALPELLRTTAGSDVPYETPNTDTERLIAQIWQAKLKLEQVGRQSNFFDLGGHSLIATKIVAEVRQQLEIDITARDLFATMTVEAFARRIDQMRSQLVTEYELSEY
ncbi:non-ribosomal peptide synthetase [Ahniella affigens]|uniref:non-ribosomal peptide synthetase n=1 Tax=Ahniella affigens TaxID=2021234 RepID=UPI001473048B|nr:non-ribosomal peptide synthetase [Ahniella affigens]